MIKNGHPCTLEENSSDTALLSDISYEDAISVGRWIMDNIRISKEVCNRTSYGLKHELEHATKVYLTNNQFKDAMYLAGFMPVNETELNWRYRIIYLKDEIFNPNPFLKWAEKRKTELSPAGDFIRDALSDYNFPAFADNYLIEEYLERIGACPESQDAFKELWVLYKEEQ